MSTRLGRLVVRSVISGLLVPAILAMWSEAGRLISSSSDSAVAIGVVLFLLAFVVAGGAVWLPASEILRLSETRAARNAALRFETRIDGDPRNGDRK